MPQDNTTAREATSYHAAPPEAFHRPEPLAADFALVTAQPPPSAEFAAEARPRRKANRGSFKPDPRRHVFTPEECSAGFWAAIAVLGVGIGRKLHKAGRWPN